jgi:branched-chain amino acid transport system permease protein
MTSAIQDVINALSLGGLYALAALGIALIFGVMRLINFAHGELIMVGAYALWIFADYEWPITLGLTIVLVAVLAVIMERVAFRPVRDAPAATLLVTSFFVASVLQNLAIIIFGSRPKTMSILPGLLNEVEVGTVRIQEIDIVTVAVSLGLLAAVALFLTRTLTGIQIRAASENFSMARLLGVRGNRVIPTAFLISGILAAVVAIFLIGRTGNVFPTVGLQPALVGFIATVLGGMGSLNGAVLGGFVLGALTVGLQSRLPADVYWFGSPVASYRDAFVFAAVILLLIWKPNGLLPARMEGDRV